MTYRVRKFDAQIEKDILTGLIVSDVFLKKIENIIDINLLSLNASKTVATWVLEYYKQYKKAPGATIQQIFKDKSRFVNSDDIGWVEDLLLDVSERYEQSGINEAYLFDSATKYLKSQFLKYSSRKVADLVDKGDIDGASIVWEGKSKASSFENLGFNPFDLKTAAQLMYEEEARVLMDLGIPSLDKMTGKMKDGWLVLAMGPMKRGKTSFLIHAAVRSLQLGYNVVFYSLEANDLDMAQRFWMNAGSMSSEVKEEERALDFGELVEGREDDDWRVKPETLIRPSVRDSGSVVNMIRKLGRDKRRGRLVVKTFPAFSAGFEDIERHLDGLEVYEKFTPHIVLVDYIGIMTAPRSITGRDVYDYNTKKLKGLAGERKVLCFSATQGTRKALDKSNLKGSDTAEDIRQLANVDVMLGLNQSSDEMEEGTMRVNILAHRYRKSNPFLQAMVLQQPGAGQFHIDDALVYTGKKKEEKNGGSDSRKD